MRAMRRLAMAGLCVVAAMLGGSWSEPAGAARTVSTPSILPATLTLTGGSRAIPPSFLGLSVEYKELQAYENEGKLFDRVISLIKPEDGTRMLLRIGGKSADHVYWQGAGADPPQWVSFIDPAWLTRLGELVGRNGLRVMLDLNLAVHSPSLALSFATAARQALPRGSLMGLEIGNEPDLYWRQPQLEKQRIPTTLAGAAWATNYSAADYRRDYAAYASALIPRLPGVVLGSPDIVSSKPAWLSAVEGLGKLNPGFLAIHRYASSTCWPPKSPWYPTIGTMLSENASAGLAATVQTAATYAHAHDQALRLTEVNSISCGGNQGVANSFATALWAPDVLFEMIRTGVNSVSWHIRPSTLNAPFIAHPTSITAMPELYGLATFAQMIRPGGQLLNTKLSTPGAKVPAPGAKVPAPGATVPAPGALHLKAWAVSYSGGMRVLLINKGAVAANTTLDLGQFRHAFLKRLLAPKIGSTTGVTLGGQSIGPDGRWHGTLRAASVPGRKGQYQVSVPGYSAALINLYG